MRSRLEVWDLLAASVASNPRIRTGKQAKAMIDFLMKEREKVVEEEAARTKAIIHNNPALKHEPQPDGSCSCEKRPIPGPGR